LNIYNTFTNFVKCITNGKYYIICLFKHNYTNINKKNFFHYRNIDKNKHFSSEIRSAMYLIPTLDTQEEVLTILNKIQLCDEPGAAGR
jgi:hypothetical protein